MNVVKDVVVQMSFSPHVKEPVSTLKIDPKRLRKVMADHVGGAIYYTNDELGLTYEVQRGNVDAIYYQTWEEVRSFCIAVVLKRSMTDFGHPGIESDIKMVLEAAGR